MVNLSNKSSAGFPGQRLVYQSGLIPVGLLDRASAIVRLFRERLFSPALADPWKDESGKGRWGDYEPPPRPQLRLLT